MAVLPAPFPGRDPIANPADGFRLTRPWVEWFTSQSGILAQSPIVLEAVETPSTQAAAIGPTSLAPALTAGLYRVSWYARITRAASTSSSLQVVIGWTEGGATMTTTGAAVTGNTTTTTQSGIVPLLRIDGGTPIVYSTTYSSSGATGMQYRLDLTLERVVG